VFKKSQGLPKDHPVLMGLLQLLDLGYSAKAQLASGKEGDMYVPDPEQSLKDVARNVLPCYMEIVGYLLLIKKYDAHTWEGQPHDKAEMQVGSVAVGFTVRCTAC
jgi:hypothetical protein